MASTPSAVVTGAAMGIGLAVAQRLAADGYHVVCVDWNAEALERALANLGGEASAVAGDIGDWSTHERAADAAEAAGRLTAWVNNAGIDWSARAHEADAEHIDRGLRVLLNGPMYGTAVAVRRMLATGGGAIVNVASIQGLAAFPGYYVYGVAKAGVAQIARNVCIDYAHHGIRCNTVLPGTVQTPMTDSVLPAGVSRDEALRIEGELAPMGRVAQPVELAGAIAFLLSDEASYINGTGLTVDGGSMARCFAYEATPL
jgi:NAD(P)-dependent dehydrogenase (short-subunit alcohol dehydrogenase family)